MCRYDMKVDDELGVKQIIKKPTCWLSSSEPIIRWLSSMCRLDNEHGSLLNGEAAQATVYPDRLCVEILKGMRERNERHDYRERHEGGPEG